jgi:glucosamine--fructose-6-phosphate aminotransferase (isomerizing)
LRLAVAKGRMSPETCAAHIRGLQQLPALIEETLKTAPLIETIAARFSHVRDCLYLGRGVNYPIALEGALKLKEISYIHAEGYPAGEMKHGPIALIDEQMPVVAIAPEGEGFEKMVGNIQEVKARSGRVIALVTAGDDRLQSILDPGEDAVIVVPKTSDLLTPILMTIPLQLLAYYVAVRRGCDVDQPRNLAKSVTVE